MTTFTSWDESLCHHGIKGQKWGIRRFQNEDGSLTKAGQNRYGDTKPKEYGKIESAIRYGHFGSNSKKNEKRVEKLEAKKRLYNYRSKHTILGKDTNDKQKAKWQEKAKDVDAKIKAQKAKNANREAYDSRTSTGKMVAQNMLFGLHGGELYRNARARGEKKGRAIAEAMLQGSITMAMSRAKRDKEAYGKKVR